MQKEVPIPRLATPASFLSRIHMDSDVAGRIIAINQSEPPQPELNPIVQKLYKRRLLEKN
jgi:hypothetical protein